MSFVSRVAAIAGLGLCIAWSSAAPAQQQGGDLRYETIRNKVGLLRYCRDKGLLDAATTDKAIRQAQGELKPLPAPADKGRGDAAERAGQAGLFGVTRRDVATFATLMGTTPAELCQGWSEN